jgi:hypothetical protein
MVYRKTDSRNVLGDPLPPKVIHRGHPDVEVSQGNHSVSGMDLLLHPGHSPIEILHLPWRSNHQFERKVRNAGSGYARNLDLSSSLGNAKRLLYRVYQEGKLDAYYQHEVRRTSQVDRELRSGALVLDHRLRDFLRDLGKKS